MSACRPLVMFNQLGAQDERLTPGVRNLGKVNADIMRFQELGEELNQMIALVRFKTCSHVNRDKAGQCVNVQLCCRLDMDNE